jgi:hypothetical protein
MGVRRAKIGDVVTPKHRPLPASPFQEEVKKMR